MVEYGILLLLKALQYFCGVLQLESLKVSELKEYLKAVGKRGVGRKQELIAEIYNHLGYDC